MMPRARLNFQTFQIHIFIQKSQVQLYLSVFICWAVIIWLYRMLLYMSKPCFSSSFKFFMIFVCFRGLCIDLNFPWYPSKEHYHTGIHEPLELLLCRSAPSRSCFFNWLGSSTVQSRISQLVWTFFQCGPFLFVDPYYHADDNLFFLLFQFYLPSNFFDYEHDSLLSPYPHSVYPRVESSTDLSVL